MALALIPGNVELHGANGCCPCRESGAEAELEPPVNRYGFTLEAGSERRRIVKKMLILGVNL